MINKRVLIIDTELPNITCDKLRPFFDVTIAVGIEAAKFCGSPDILISSRTDPHVNGVLDLSMYEEYKRSILCIVQSELNTIKGIAKYHSSYALSWQPSTITVSAEFGASSSIQYCLSSADPGLHLAMASGATDIYSSSVQRDAFQHALDVLISEKSGYIPTNILRPVRPQFLDEVRLCQ